MKKWMTTLGAICLLFSAMAQNENYSHTISANAGFSVLGAAFNLLDNSDLSDSQFIDNLEGLTNLSGQLSANSAPAIEFNYDYGLTNWFSIGGGLAYQGVNAEVSDLTYTDGESGESVALESAKLKINRTHVGIRALFHYGNKNRMDLYSGFRVGLTNWGTKVEASNSTFEEDLNASSIVGLSPSVQFIPFALRGYVTENIGISFETGIGTPHFFALGVNYRM